MHASVADLMATGASMTPSMLANLTFSACAAGNRVAGVGVVLVVICSFPTRAAGRTGFADRPPAHGLVALYGFHPVPVRTFTQHVVADALADAQDRQLHHGDPDAHVFACLFRSARAFRGETFVLMMLALLGMMVRYRRAAADAVYRSGAHVAVAVCAGRAAACDRRSPSKRR
jgi:hypothetical protein